MKRLHTLYRLCFAALLLIGCLALSSCIDVEEHNDTPQGNLEALWKILDEHYCFFDYKQHEYGLYWNAVYEKYKVRVDAHMNNEQLFEVLADMLSELRDGHVNLSASHDFARYWKWHEDFPVNFDVDLQRNYLGTDYKIAGGMKYKILDDNIGYIYYESFDSGIGEGNLDDILVSMAFCDGIILDIRNNSGGLLTHAEKLASRFTNEKRRVGYMQHKTGNGHHDFSAMEEQYIEPSANVRWQKPVALLVNRHVYSAANEFAKYMHVFPLVKLVGDRTGGGAGLPFSSSLPNGWLVRFSACPMYDPERQSTEFGIAPDYPVALNDADAAQGKDSIIEFARKLLRQ